VQRRKLAPLAMTGLALVGAAVFGVVHAGSASAALIDVLSALKDGDSLHAARGTRGVRVDYRFAARCRHGCRSYLRSTVV
jgi:hypothetical protein